MGYNLYIKSSQIKGIQFINSSIKFPSPPFGSRLSMSEKTSKFLSFHKKYVRTKDEQIPMQYVHIIQYLFTNVIFVYAMKKSIIVFNI